MVKIVLVISFIFGLQLKAEDKIIDLATYKDIDGKKITVDQKTEKVFLYFWAHWCPDCEGKFTGFFPKYKEQIKIPVITINTDSKENKVRGFIEKNKVKMPVIMDLDNSIRKLAGVNGVPAYAILIKQKDGKYKITESKVGLDESDLMKALDLK
jgi:peroxiredoxin